MNRSLNIVIPYLLIVFLCMACTKDKNLRHGIAEPANVSITPDATDCSGYISEMKIMYGLNTKTGLEGAGEHGNEVFARVLAVDHVDGTMSVSILPPGNGEFDMDFITALTTYNLKFIACNENASSALGGISTSGVCTYAGPVNILGGGDNLKEHQFTSDGFKAEINGDWTQVLATRNPGTDEGKRLPTFIMLTATNKNSNMSTIGHFIVASGDSPYKFCYYGY